MQQTDILVWAKNTELFKIMKYNFLKKTLINTRFKDANKPSEIFFTKRRKLHSLSKLYKICQLLWQAKIFLSYTNYLLIDSYVLHGTHKNQRSPVLMSMLLLLQPTI